MAKYPSEIFGYPHWNKSAKATETRQRHWCPFVNKICYKQSRLIDFPFGVCSAHVSGEEIALCPRRFLDQHAVFSDVALHHFHTTDNILVFSEIRLGDMGNFDFVMLKHKPLSAEIEDFVAIEFQTGQTTGTGQLVKGLTDFLANQRTDYKAKSYNFGLNMYDIWKRTFTQILNKGVIMESWSKKIYWIIQDPIFRNFETRYNLHHLTFEQQHSTVFALYDLKAAHDRFELVASRKVSASMDQLFASFRNNPNIPPVEKFVKSLEAKIEGEAQISLRLGRPSRTGSVDIKPPTASGKLHEDSGDKSEADPPEGTT